MKVNSSTIDEIDYVSGLMYVKYKNWAIYQYEWVQPDHHRKIINADSKWSELKKILKTYSYKYKKL